MSVKYKYILFVVLSAFFVYFSGRNDVRLITHHELPFYIRQGLLVLFPRELVSVTNRSDFSRGLTHFLLTNFLHHMTDRNLKIYRNWHTCLLVFLLCLFGFVLFCFWVAEWIILNVTTFADIFLSKTPVCRKKWRYQTSVAPFDFFPLIKSAAVWPLPFIDWTLRGKQTSTQWDIGGTTMLEKKVARNQACVATARRL